MSKINFVLKSGNVKTGKIPVTYSERSTCPMTCAFYNSGCYGRQGKCLMHWQKVSTSKNASEVSGLCAKIKALPEKQIWRHNVVGDLAGKNLIVNGRKLKQLVNANKGKMGYTYTHKPVLTTKHAKNNQEAIKQANLNGFTVNLSADNLEQADKLKALNIAPVCVVLPLGSANKLTTPKGNPVIVCPAQQNESMTCSQCKLCAKQRNVIIGFVAHGTMSKTVSKMVASK